ncbi:aldehyde dehydrogenase family protein [Spirosoma sp. KNUC1025]|nr:aldehyde dehydrogenase family protein [Spirosoma sp. KNUC1025]
METLTIPSTASLDELFTRQQRKARQLKKSTVAERIDRLKKLKNTLLDHSEAILGALYADFKKPVAEAELEISPIIGEIDFAVANLEQWMPSQVVPTPEAMGGSAVTSKIVLEPKGVCLLITPWNYPVLLTFRPLVSCIAAGNTAIIKPSELTPHSATIIRQVVEAAFDEGEVAVIEGGSEVASELLKLPFHHIFYTGGSRVGKIVMKAAANYLASVTLELGVNRPLSLMIPLTWPMLPGK